MNYIISLLLSFIVFYSCSGGSVKSKGKKLPFQIIAPDLRVEKFPDTFNMKAEGPVVVDCGGKACTQKELDKMSVAQIKNFPKKGEWKIYVQKEDEKKNKISVFNASGEYKDNKREGLWKFFFETGAVMREVNYTNDMKNGIEKKYNLKGEQTEETVYANDKKEGKYWKKDKGVPVEEGTYKADKKEGVWTFYYTTGAKKSEEEFRDDKRNGSYKAYYKDGTTLSSEGSYNGNLKSGNWKMYYDTGKIQSEGGYQPRLAPGENAPKEGEEAKSFRSGRWKEYYKSGDLFAEGNREHTRTGTWTFYNKGNVPRFRGAMANEVMMKSAEVFDEKGQMIGKGSLIFSIISINENDEMKSSFRPSNPYIYYKNGIKAFEVKSEDKEGNITAVAYDDNGSRLGEGPIAPGTIKKNGCWNMNGKKTYFLMDKENKKFAEMQGCK